MAWVRRVDGFHLLSGLTAIAAGPIMLLAGGPAGWAFLLIVDGLLVLLANWIIASEITFEVPDAVTVLLGFVGVAGLWTAVIYLTRAANDLPTIFPGYNPVSENFRLIPGVLALTVGAVALARAIAAVRPRFPVR